MIFAACIQARLGSTRLPEKVLRPLAGQTMFESILQQVHGCQSIQKIVLTTSDAGSDDRLVQYALGKGLSVFRGPVDNIVTRLLGALQTTRADALVRIWGDCPFICPDIIDSMIRHMQEKNLDFIHNSDISKRTFPPGLDIEIYRRSLLEKMDREVRDEKLREFPVEFVKAQKNIGYELFSAPEDFSGVHLTVDYAEDLAAAEELYTYLSAQKSPFDFPLLVKVLKTTKLAQNFSHGARNIEYQKFLSERKAPNS